MKFIDYLFAPGVRPMSVGIGFLVGLGTALFTDWMFGVFVGAVTVLILSFLIPVTVYFQEIPYNRIKKRLPKPFLFDERVRFSMQDGSTVAGYFILTEEQMIFLTLEKGEHRMELSHDEIQRIRLDEEAYCINIYLDETKFVRVQTPICEKMLRMLTEKGWG